MHRRHLNSSQKAAVAVELKEMWQKYNPQGRPEKGGINSTFNQKSRDLAGKSMGVSGRYVDEAEKISNEDPGAFEKIKSGEMTMATRKSTAT